jgi:uncharacterized protein YifE (UPF0438 family)
MRNDDKKTHFNYIEAKGKFTVACNHIIFSDIEIELLEKYGHWFEALTSGELSPFNPEQKQFVEAARLNIPPQTDYEKVWVKYIKRRQIESKAGSILYTSPMPEDDTFYSRDMAINLKRKMFGDYRG